MINFLKKFENINRIFITIKDLVRGKEFAKLSNLIQSEFLLSEPLADKYASIVFIQHFRLDTTKRRLRDLTFEDYDYFASLMMSHWTSSNQLKIDLDFNSIRDLKIYLYDSNEIEEYRRKFRKLTNDVLTVSINF